MDQLVVKHGESLVEIERKGGKILSENKFFTDLCSLMKNVEFILFINLIIFKSIDQLKTKY